jgi:hypothetical protein
VRREGVAPDRNSNELSRSGAVSGGAGAPWRVNAKGREFKMKRVFLVLLGVGATILAVAPACGGNDGNAATATPKPAEVAATPTKAELTALFKTAKSSLQDVVTKSKANDVKGTKDAFEASDKPMEAVIKAVRPLDAALADGMEKRELDIEKQADVSSPDLASMGKNASEILPLLDQAGTKLQLTP